MRRKRIKRYRIVNYKRFFIFRMTLFVAVFAITCVIIFGCSQSDAESSVSSLDKYPTYYEWADYIDCLGKGNFYGN